MNKYKRIVESKNRKYGVCDTILIREVFGEESAILIQNAFPTLEKYIDHVHMRNGQPAKIVESLKEEILDKFNKMLSLKENGKNFFFTDIDKIKTLMMEELDK